MNTIKLTQKLIDSISLAIILCIVFIPSSKNLLWDISLIAVTILMSIRPLNDLFPSMGFIKLLPLRKNLGILSALIVVGFGIMHYITLGTAALSTYFSLSYWSGSLFWAHLGELTGLILLITSNKRSMRLLRRNWKRVQRLSYLYFFSGAWYVYVAFGKSWALIAIIIIFELTLLAFIKNRFVINEEHGEVTWQW